MESELTIFLTTIDTPEFRRNNLAKVRAKAAVASVNPDARLPAPASSAESVEFALLTTRSPAVERSK